MTIYLHYTSLYPLQSNWNTVLPLSAGLGGVASQVWEDLPAGAFPAAGAAAFPAGAYRYIYSYKL